MKRVAVSMVFAMLIPLSVGTATARADGAATGRIAFSLNTDGHWHLFTVAPDGTDERQLTSAAKDDWASSWSPDGSTLAFERRRSYATTPRMWTVSTDGSAVLTRLGRGSSPIWSPHGRRLAFSSVGAKAGELWFVRADGTHRHPANVQVCGSTVQGAGGPSDWYRQDGSWIVLSWSCANDPNDSSIWKVRPDGSDPQQLVSGGGDSLSGGRMSPDGQTVVFSRAYVGEDGGGDDIDRTYPVGWSYFHNAFDGFQCEVDGQWGWYCGAARPSWSPDGTQVGYGAEGYDNVQWICVINADDQTAGTRLVQGWSPLWSPATAR